MKAIVEKLSEFTLPCQSSWGIFMPDAAKKSEEPGPLNGCVQEVLNHPDKCEDSK